jgi:hypothetical protein
MSTWKAFFDANSDTLGVSQFFAFIGSGFLLWMRSSKIIISAGSGLMLLVAGQIVGGVATSFVVGYLQWSPYLAPFIGVIAGLTGFFLLMMSIKAGQQVENRGGDIGNAVVDKVARHKEDDK